MGKRGRKSKEEMDAMKKEMEKEDSADFEKRDEVHKEVKEAQSLSPMELAAVEQKGGGFLYVVKFIQNVNNLPQNAGEIAGFSAKMAASLVRDGFAVWVDVSRE